MPPAFIATGFCVGLLIGLTGVGGGSVMTPILVLVFGIQATTAIGTDLLFAACTKAFGTAVHGANRTVAWRLVWRLGAGSVPGAIAAILLLGQIGVHGAAANRLSLGLLGAMLLLAAASLAAKPWIARRGGGVRRAPPAWITIALGFGLGVTVTLSSVGAGALGTVVLIYLYPELSLAEVVGSDIAHAVLLTMVAGFGRLWLHGIDVPMLGALLAGSLPGVAIGSLLVRRAPERLLRYAIAAMLGMVGLRVLLDLA
ncbi:MULTISPECIES: sulfite exporter TauE/SafE family protein [unclassified Acidiphilium]|uniref:sulfite exporter TauE/SafE family protein n=1 Tax=unclassified Acidiphilium TaxID=2617493 RepID=UPI000BC63DFE|nr:MULTISPECIES: sulfite exporter TauE/SafE family protein [unclassified Acidiphilium]OYV55681.1 MAG: hypothetical protein B7Z76_09440 [Acidiphilium sp. 20-67-58]HQT61440.1 sulfite exporter TauE/SafE family protein [Acidiphilium sp.]